MQARERERERAIARQVIKATRGITLRQINGEIDRHRNGNDRGGLNYSATRLKTIHTRAEEKQRSKLQTTVSVIRHAERVDAFAAAAAVNRVIRLGLDRRRKSRRKRGGT